MLILSLLIQYEILEKLVTYMSRTGCKLKTRSFGGMSEHGHSRSRTGDYILKHI